MASLVLIIVSAVSSEPPLGKTKEISDDVVWFCVIRPQNSQNCIVPYNQNVCHYSNKSVGFELLEHVKGRVQWTPGSELYRGMD